MYKLTCEVCLKVFQHSQPHKKCCSVACHQQAYFDKYRRKVEGLKLATGTVGAIAELEVCADLLKKGYCVFRSVSPTCPFDLAVYFDDRMFSLEVRTGYLDIKGKIAFSNKSRVSVDIYAVRDRNSGKIFYLDKNKKTVNLKPWFERVDAGWGKEDCEKDDDEKWGE